MVWDMRINDEGRVRDGDDISKMGRDADELRTLSDDEEQQDRNDEMITTPPSDNTNRRWSPARSMYSRG